ncbi:MAG: Fe-S cluster assembly sulfur transfer protein SufU [Sandaracinaceae bacterium]
MDLRELYQEYVLDHGRNPRNFAFPEGSTHEAEGYNPLCGDKLAIKLVLDGDVIRDIGFQGQGCAISTASASTMTEAVKGKTLAEAKAYFEGFLAMVRGEGDLSGDAPEELAIFGGVAQYPMRVKCATLAWHTLTAALEKSGTKVSTE